MQGNYIVSEDALRKTADKVGVDAERVLDRLINETELISRRIIQDAIKFMRRSKRNRLTIKDLDNSMSLHGRPSITPTYQNEENLSKVSNKGKELYFIDDETVDLNKMAKFGLNSLPLAPSKPSIKIHWLVVDGVQPETPENPSFERRLKEEKVKIKLFEDKMVVLKRDLAKKKVPEELQVYFQKISHSVINYRSFPKERAQECEIIFSAVEKDISLKPILHSLIRFIGIRIKQTLKNHPLDNIKAALRLCLAILKNNAFSCEDHLEELLPPLISCIVTRSFGEISPGDDHFALRQNAANVVKIICDRYKLVFTDLQSRVIKSIRPPIDLDKSMKTKKKALTAIFGSVVGLTAMGPIVIEKHILHRADLLLDKLYELKASEELSAVSKQEIKMIEGSITNAIGVLVKAERISSELQRVSERLGERLMCFYREKSDPFAQMFL